jgi:glutamate transport system substrate-binding protein
VTSHRRRTARFGLFLVIALALVATACGSSNDDKSSATTSPKKTNAASTDPAVAAIKGRGKLVVGIKYDQPGFGLRTASGEFTGFDVEIAKLLAAQILGDSSKVEFKETPSKIREQSIQNGDVDLVIATYTINDERKKVISFAGPYYQAGQDVMVRADDDSIKKVEDLNGKKVCSVTGSTSIENIADAAPDADISQPFDTYSKCAEELKNKRVDAVTTDDSILYGLANLNKGEFRVLGKSFTKEPYGIGLKKDDAALRTYVNKFLEKIEANGDWQKAFAATVGKIRADKVTPPPIDQS